MRHPPSWLLGTPASSRPDDLSPPRYHSMLVAALAAFGLRLFFILKFPATAGDTAAYEELAGNWAHHGVYGLLVDGRLEPVMIRLPGYPVFLAAVHAVLGHSPRAVMLVQAGIDVLTCFLVAALAVRFLCLNRALLDSHPAPGPAARPTTRNLSRLRRDPQSVFRAVLWLAALCPFTANYTAVLLTETLATFLGALSLLLLLDAFAADQTFDLAEHRPDLRLGPWRRLRLWLLGGFVAGLGTLVRPETPLLLAGVGLGLGVAWRRPRHWPKLARAAALMALGLLLPLLPWAARNWHTFGQVQFLAPRYAQMPGEFVPKGFYQWTHTWLVRFPDIDTTVWKVGDEEIDIDDVPSSAFDSPAERSRVAELLDQYNEEKTMTPALAAGFAEVARQRTARRPLRTYLWVPLGRVGTLWFWPRVELLPYSGTIFPLREAWGDDHADFLVSTGFSLLALAYAGLAVFGLWWARRCPAAWLAVAYLVLRTAFLTQIVTPEPRYVLPAYPIVLALAGIALRGRRHRIPTY